MALQTVYNSVGNTAALLSAVLDAAASGPHSPSNVLELMRQRTAEAPDFDALIAVLADWFVEVHRRTGPVMGVIAQAAAAIWSLGHPQTYRTLVRGDAARTVKAYRGWLLRSLGAACA